MEFLLLGKGLGVGLIFPPLLLCCSDKKETGGSVRGGDWGGGRGGKKKIMLKIRDIYIRTPPWEKK